MSEKKNQDGYVDNLVDHLSKKMYEDIIDASLKEGIKIK
jgi:hypothetical protein